MMDRLTAQMLMEQQTKRFYGEPKTAPASTRKTLFTPLLRLIGLGKQKGLTPAKMR